MSPGWRNGDCDQAECPTGGAAEYCDRDVECSHLRGRAQYGDCDFESRSVLTAAAEDYRVVTVEEDVVAF